MLGLQSRWACNYSRHTRAARFSGIQVPLQRSTATPQNAAKAIKTFFCKVSESGNVELKRNHAYYYQVQGSLAITLRLWCDFVVWTPQHFLVERILFDAEQWKTTKQKLVDFYKKAILPELASPRHVSGQSIRELTRTLNHD